MAHLFSKTTLAFSLALTAAGCSSKSSSGGGSDAPTAGATKPLWDGFDGAAEIKKLAGKWQVQEQGVKSSRGTWEITGNNVVSVVGEKTKKGVLSIDVPGRISFKEPDGRTHRKSYARDGDRIWIGISAAGAKVGSNYFVSGMWGMVHFDGKACTYKKFKRNFNSDGVEFEADQTVKCAVEGDTFTYQEPKFMKEGEFEDKSVKIVGTALVHEQMLAEHLLVKAP